ncbi:hypothetical protein Tco_1168165, partial [Tanacetum coccineum]
MEANLDRAPKPKDDVVDTNKDTNSATSRYNDVLKLKPGGSLLDVMDYNMEGCIKNIEAIIGSQGDHQGANLFNNFITMTGLVDLPLEGYSYTWSHKTASIM